MLQLFLLLTQFLVTITISDSNNNVIATGYKCRCVLSHLCSDDDAAVNGQGLFDIRMETKACPNPYEVCCENPIDQFDSPQTGSNQNSCGFGKSIPTSRITSDSESTQFGELPWTAIILLRDIAKTERNIYKCGGSLIHPQVILTAAHCIYETNSKYLTIRLGDWNTRNQDEALPYQERLVKEVIIHPQFHPGSLKHDIALIFVDDPFILMDNVGVICLPLGNFDIVPGVRCIAGGFGKESIKNGKHSNILRKVDLPLVDREICQMLLRRTRLGSYYSLHSSFICAGGEENKDTCKGDGGSPLVCPIPGQIGRFFQIGIVAWGIGCGGSETPGVYVNVPFYSDWIDKQLLERNLDFSINKF